MNMPKEILLIDSVWTLSLTWGVRVWGWEGEWIGFAASHLPLHHGPTPRIGIIIDNATWHNELTEDSKPPKWWWRKDQIQQWLIEHKVKFDPKLTKAELLEIALHHVPPKQYKTNVAAIEYDIQIVRLPFKHCVLNPIELAWAQLKAYVRTNNTLFRLTDISSLAWLLSTKILLFALSNMLERLRKFFGRPIISWKKKWNRI